MTATKVVADRVLFQNALERERITLAASELIYELMEAEGVCQADLARRIGRSRGYVSQVLNGRRNMTLGTLVDMTGALGYQISLHPKRKGRDE